MLAQDLQALGTPKPPIDSCSVLTSIHGLNGYGLEDGNLSGTSLGMCNITQEQTPAQAFLQGGEIHVI